MPRNVDIPAEPVERRVEERRKSVKRIPAFEPFVIRGRTFQDEKAGKSIWNSEQQMSVHRAVGSSIADGPADMRCDTPSNHALIRVKDDPVSRKFDLTSEECSADTPARTFATFDGDEVFGAFHLFNIRVLEQTDAGFKVSCRMFLNYPGTTSLAQHARHAADTWEEVSDYTFLLADGRTLDVVRLGTSIPPMDDPPQKSLRRAKATIDLLNQRRADQGGAFLHDFSDDPYDRIEIPDWRFIAFQAKRKSIPELIAEQRIADRRES